MIDTDGILLLFYAISLVSIGFKALGYTEVMNYLLIIPVHAAWVPECKSTPAEVC